MVEISVLISNHNYGHFIDQAIQSVLQQTRPPHEILVYDDGSEDDSVQRINQWPVTLIRGGHRRGVASARNALVECATGTHLLFLDADDWLEPRALEAAAQRVESRPEVEATYCDFRFVTEDDAVGFPAVRRRTPPTLTVDTCFQVLHFIPCHTLVFPTSWAIPFDTSLSTSEDQAFWSELLLRGARFSYIDSVLSAYRLHGRSRSANRRLQSLRNQVSIHRRLIERYPAARKHDEFTRHVRWRKYKLGMELLRHGRRWEGAQVLMSSLRRRDDAVFQRLGGLAVGILLPTKVLQVLTRIRERLIFPEQQ